MSTTCCACFAKIAVRGSHGFIKSVLSSRFSVDLRLVRKNRELTAWVGGQECPPYTVIYCRTLVVLLHYDFCRHLGMNRAKIGVDTGLGKSESELFVGVERA